MKKETGIRRIISVTTFIPIDKDEKVEKNKHERAKILMQSKSSQ
jgi:hypothetical protein